jgi:uncharacterized protein YndB with AHSA1/START domain
MAANSEKISSATTAPAHDMEREVIITRLFNAPRALVFQAWTDPQHLARWWGPKGFSNPVCEADVRPGGAWRIVMRGPDGTEYPGGGVYHEIVVPERLVFTNIAWDRGGKPILDGLTTVTFAEHGGGTKLVLQTRATGLVSYAAQMLEGMEAGWTQSLERLEALVQSATADREIVTTRTFDAPRDLVWEAWTRPEHIVRWWGPNGFTTTIHEMDVKPGGVWRFVMHGPDGVDYPNLIAYREVVKPERLAYSHGPSPLFDVNVIFEERRGRTELTMRALFETAAQRDQVIKDFGALEGAKQALARLAEFLANA